MPPAGPDRLRSPFRGRSRETLTGISAAAALNHPTWDMGPVVTINSSTLVNKGLELIEAHLLFDVAPEQIDVVIHPQSVIHSMVEFIDGGHHRPGLTARHGACHPPWG